MTIYIRAANLRTIRQQEAEIVQQFRFAQLEFRAHPVGLKRREDESAASKREYLK